MSIFQCEHCGCAENTALSCQGIGKSEMIQDWFDWTGIEDRRGKMLCSACAPPTYKDGSPSGMGVWHKQFKRKFLPIGEYQTNGQGNLERKRNPLGETHD